LDGSPGGSGKGLMNAATQALVRPRAAATGIGKALALLSLALAMAGLFLYYTVEKLEAPLPAWGGLRLADVWMLSGLLLLGSAGVLLLGGTPRKGQLLSFVRFAGWAVWGVAEAAVLLFVITAVIAPRQPLGSQETWARLAAAGLGTALAFGAVAFDFRESPWVQRHRNALLNSTALALGLLAAFGVAEWAMRNVFRPPVFADLFTKSQVPGCGFEMKPGFDGMAGNARARLNSDGFRSPEIAPQKTRKRILAVGDSVTFGGWVEQDKSFPAILQRLLPADRYEVINAGVPAYDLEQVMALFKGKGARFQPDVVVYTFVYDDLNDPLVLGEGGALHQQPGKRYGGPVLVQDRFRFFPMPRSLVSRSRLLTAIVMRYYRYREERNVSGDRDLQPEVLAERWGWLDERLVELRGEVEEAGAKFLLVIFPVGLSEPSIERLVSIARKDGIETVNLRGVLGDAKTYAAKYMTAWDAHPNAAAHALMAQAIYEGLVQARFIETVGSAKP